MLLKNISCSGIISLSLFSLILIACGGGSKLSLDEAKEVTLNYQGANYTPPPRGVDKLIKEIQSAGEGLAEDQIGRRYDNSDLDDPDIPARIQNLRKVGAVAHIRGNSQQAVNNLKTAYELLKHPDVAAVWSKGTRNEFDHTYFGVLHVYSRILLDVGNYSDSVRIIKNAIEIQESRLKPRKGKLAFEYSHLATAYALLGDTEEAEDALSEAENYLSSMKYKSERSQRFQLFHEQISLMTKGIIESSLGNLRDAESLFIRAIDEMEYHTQGRKGSTWARRARVMGDYLVNNLLAQGRIAEAEAQSIVAIRYALEKFGDKSFYTATVLKGYIKVLMARERYDDAGKIIALTKNILDSIGAQPTSIERIKLKMSLADIYIAKDDWSKAKNIYIDIYNSLEKEPEVRKGLFYNNLNWAVILAYTNQIDDAEKVATAAIENNSDIFGSNHTETALAKGVLAMVKTRQGNNAVAKELYENIMPVFIEAKDGQIISGAKQQRMRLIFESYLFMLAEQFKQGDKSAASRAFYVSQLVQGKNVQNAVASSAARASIKDIELVKLVRQEQNAKRKIESGFNTLAVNHGLVSEEGRALSKDIKSRIEQLVKARESILSEINNRFPEYANLVRPKPVTIEQASSVLQYSESLIFTYSGSNDLYVWTLSKNGSVHLNRRHISKHELKLKVQKLRKALDLQVASLSEVPDFNIKLAYDLYNIILRPGAHVWRGSKNLVIVADSSLSSIPFTVLVTEESDGLVHNKKLLFAEYRNVAWLANKHATSYAPSVSTLVNLRNLVVDKKPALKFAGFGNPVFGSSSTQVVLSGDIKSRGINKLSMRGLRKTNLGSLDKTKSSKSNLDMLVALPETADEVLQVAGALNVTNKGNVFLGAAANEQRVKTMTLHNRRIVMFATHALLPGDLDGLVQPAIALTAPATSKRTDNNDGLLTMGEVMGLNLNADWVVLSACNTGAASGRGASAVSGLGQAFFYAGARSLLVSHWPVETSSAKLITTGLFQRQVGNKSLTRAVALNETVKDLIQNKNYHNSSGESIYSYAHPVFWAPFTVVGNGIGTLL